MQWIDSAGIYKSLEDEKIIMFYKGPVPQETLVDMGAFLKSMLYGNPRIKTIFAIFVEMAHNILYHSAEREVVDLEGNDIGVGLIILREQPHHFVLKSCNPLNRDDVSELRRKLGEIKDLSNEELRKLYVSKRKTGENRTQKGAGLGLIEIAKRADTQLDFDIQSFNDQFDLLNLTATIAKGG
ncbi:SiaB family protein kinase [Acanthopleuribacter pedis]|uniref:SiaB family protein kinase n=1 Tax=Acanthopleuribacter pedis TaxID=442870 RepID=A0A8J7Q8N5_9BACT|nr:SiaB family protein kinase [Acanthopleuribacter pedis]MBO1319752.1 SiaB family protein kinase [Acanthopleuribacter pedis]